MAKNKRSQDDWDKYNWGLWVCEREIKLDCPWGRWNICKAVLAGCLRLSLCWLVGRHCWKVELRKVALWDRHTAGHCLLWLKILGWDTLYIVKESWLWDTESLGFTGYCLAGQGQQQWLYEMGFLRSLSVRHPAVVENQWDLDAWSFYPRSPPSSEPCAYHHPDHFPCVISLPAPHVYTWARVSFSFFFTRFKNSWSLLGGTAI